MEREGGEGKTNVGRKEAFKEELTILQVKSITVG